ncbi:GNAT family N-acetyltransferase [Portibacter lacus]|uniref:N-acetyltransferase domain-containing protein n=1 Tax=Portibacter lacus TaxID=1099794 RepID=A0AA37SVD2_9BACT|nr:GNAT family N-acetyltransferase [Portibacter lacus]GLR19960.1 hypothetical protein GCM10007940_45760 [Portibacter lacus]
MYYILNGKIRKKSVILGVIQVNFILILTIFIYPCYQDTIHLITTQLPYQVVYKIEEIEKKEYPKLVKVWEDSIRATHHFLQEEDIAYFKPLILNTYLDAVELRGIRNENLEIIGFMGVADQHLEMLFINPNYFGKGIGKTLLAYAIDQLKVTKVDVNEQNKLAVGFYEHCGFEIFSRSALDSSGKPYPILHMKKKSI